MMTMLKAGAGLKAAAGLATLTLVLASLPPGVMFMVYLTSPDYIMPLFTTMMGRFMIAVGALWMLTGVLVMRKMINFKF